MVAQILDGKTVGQQRRQQLKIALKEYIHQGHPPPGLAVVLLGEDPASMVYVRHKRKACIEMGMQSYAYDLPASTHEKQLLDLIQNLNHDPSVTGILIQLPLPNHINPLNILETIDPKKDVDGFHPYNVGRLTQGNPLLRPCTPLGIMHLLQHYQIPLQGKHAVIIGTSMIVGRPMGLELLHAKATITFCHRETQALEQHIRQADILIVATGVPDLVSPKWLNAKQVIIDVGTHHDVNGRLRGDIDFNAAKERVAWITPVPGGIGPMTIATLLENTLQAAYLQNKAN